MRCLIVGYLLLQPFLFILDQNYISSMYPARQQEILLSYTGITVGKYQTTKQGVSNIEVLRPQYYPTKNLSGRKEKVVYCIELQIFFISTNSHFWSRISHLFCLTFCHISFCKSTTYLAAKYEITLKNGFYN
jgi:hypothetical protein